MLLRSLLAIFLGLLCGLQALADFENDICLKGPLYGIRFPGGGSLYMDCPAGGAQISFGNFVDSRPTQITIKPIYEEVHCKLDPYVLYGIYSAKFQLKHSRTQNSGNDKYESYDVIAKYAANDDEAPTSRTVGELITVNDKLSSINAEYRFVDGGHEKLTIENINRIFTKFHVYRSYMLDGEGGKWWGDFNRINCSY